MPNFSKPEGNKQNNAERNAERMLAVVMHPTINADTMSQLFELLKQRKPEMYRLMYESALIQFHNKSTSAVQGCVDVSYNRTTSKNNAFIRACDDMLNAWVKHVAIRDAQRVRIQRKVDDDLEELERVIALKPQVENLERKRAKRRKYTAVSKSKVSIPERLHHFDARKALSSLHTDVKTLMRKFMHNCDAKKCTERLGSLSTAPTSPFKQSAKIETIEGLDEYVDSEDEMDVEEEVEIEE